MPLTTTRYGLTKPDAASGDTRADLYNSVRDNADVASAKLEAAHYRRIAVFTGKIGAGVTSGTKFLIGGPVNGAQSTIPDVTTGVSLNHGAFIDPTDIGGTIAKMRLRIAYDVPSTGPGQTFTFGIYQAVGLALVAGTAITAFTPAGSSQSPGLANVSADVIVPSASPLFAIGFVLGGTTAASSLVYFTAFLDAVRA